VIQLLTILSTAPLGSFYLSSLRSRFASYFLGAKQTELLQESFWKDKKK